MTVALPAELAPALRARAVELLSQVATVAEVPALDPALRRPPTPNRCVVCHRAGVLGGHHDARGRVVWVHRSCHRRLHRREQADRW